MMHTETQNENVVQKTGNGHQPRGWEWAVRPRTDITEHDDHFALAIEIPGVAMQDVDLQVEGNELRVTAARKAGEEKPTYLLRERRPVTFCRAFTLGEMVDRDRIEAKLENGVLPVSYTHLTLP
ncbi:MAG: Hsp20/alpha crystallin family protein, partial [Candidatus Eisenbacteria bacterium]|nr:Hsp20/alpha crystallin family protein [Candidatus Eisenbacteria bacterium]